MLLKKIDGLFAKDESGNFTNAFTVGLIDGINTAITFMTKLANGLKGLAPMALNALAPLGNAFNNVFGNLKMEEVVNKIVQALGKVIQ